MQEEVVAPNQIAVQRYEVAEVKARHRARRRKMAERKPLPIQVETAKFRAELKKSLKINGEWVRAVVEDSPNVPGTPAEKAKFVSGQVLQANKGLVYSEYRTWSAIRRELDRDARRRTKLEERRGKKAATVFALAEMRADMEADDVELASFFDVEDAGESEIDDVLEGHWLPGWREMSGGCPSSLMDDLGLDFDDEMY